MRLNRRQVMLGAAAGVLLVAAYSYWPSSPAPAPAEQATRARARRGAAASPAPEQSPVAVNLKALTDERDGPGEAARNPFRFQPKVAPPPPPRPAVIAPPPTEAPRPAPPPPPGPPPLPPIPLKFLGLVERANGVKWAVLSDGKSAPFYGKDGDIIDGRYLIVKIGNESIEMTYADGRGRQVIRLTGQ